MNTVYNPETLQHIGNIFRVINGKLEKMTLEEYKEEIRKSQEVQQQMKTVEAVKQEDSSRKAGQIVSVQFQKESGNDYYEHPLKRISATVIGPGEISHAQAVTREVGMNIGVEVPFRQVRLPFNVGFSFAESRTSEVNHTVEVEAGRKGHLTFSPRMYYAKGTTEVCREIRQGHGEIEVVCETNHNTEMWFPMNVPNMEILDGIYAVAYED